MKNPTINALLKANRVALGWTLLALSASNTPPAFGQALDESFNPDPTSTIYALALQPDNKILIGGSHVVRRLNPDGSTDTSFNAGLNPGGEAYSFAVQPDGKIVLGGGFSMIGGQAHTNLGRLNPDGSLDASFTAQAGQACPETCDYEWVNSLDIQADGKVLVAGQFHLTAGQLPYGLLRFNSDGTMDHTFNPAMIGAPGVVAVQPDGKILVGDVGVRRFNPDGSVDASFNPFMSHSSSLLNLALQSDGKILVAGDFNAPNGQPRSGIARLNADGSLDESFNPGANGPVSSLAVQADGRILIAGRFTTLDGQPRPRVGRLNPDGSLDITFGSVANAGIDYLALQADGQILAAAFFGTGQQTSLARFSNSTPAVQILAIDCTASRVTWSRGGSAPEVSQVTFEQSLDGASYSFSGYGRRIPGGWELAGLSLPAGQSVYIRARGRVAGMLGGGGNSTGLIESIQRFAAPWDQTPPTLVCPSDRTIDFESAAGAVATFSAEAMDDCSGPLPVICVPPSGSQFPIGASRVVCSATDPSGNRVECSFKVVVLGARSIIRSVGSDLDSIRSQAIRAQDRARLEKCGDNLSRAAASDLWLDEIHLDARHGRRVFHALEETVRTLEALQKDKHSRVPAATLQPLIDRLVKTARLLAVVQNRI